MAIIEGEEPIVSRLDRLDHMLKHLEEMSGCNYHQHNRASMSPPRSSCASSTPSSGTLNSEGGPNTSSVDDWSPRSMEKYCRPIDMVMMETQVKGNLIERLVQVEDRVLKLCMKVEQEENTPIHTPTKSRLGRDQDDHDSEDKENKGDEEHHHHHKKGIKQLVKSCVRAGKSKSASSSPKTKKHHWI